MWENSVVLPLAFCSIICCSYSVIFCLFPKIPVNYSSLWLPRKWSQSDSGNQKCKHDTVETKKKTWTKHENGVCVSYLTKQYDRTKSTIYNESYFNSIPYEIKGKKIIITKCYWGWKRLIVFTLISMRKMILACEHLVLWTVLRNELSSWAEISLYLPLREQP